jgi:hypothetical protein
MRYLKIFAVFALLPLWLAACASTSQTSLTLDQKLAEKGYVMGEQVRRIQNWNLNGWSYVDDEHFIMNSGVRDHYLVALRSPSYDLRSAINIAFTSTVGSLTDTDKVIVKAPGGFAQTFLIESLHKLEKKPPSDTSG